MSLTYFDFLASLLKEAPVINAVGKLAMKLAQRIICWLPCVLGICTAGDLTLSSVQRQLKNLQKLSTNKQQISPLRHGHDFLHRPIVERSLTGFEPLEYTRQAFIKNVLSQRHTHRPIIKTFDPIAEEERLQEYLAERLRRKHEHHPLKRKRACRGGQKSLKNLRCPSDHSVCLHDDMICNTYQDCPDGEDENPAVCLIHDWASRWFAKIQFFLIQNRAI